MTSTCQFDIETETRTKAGPGNAKSVPLTNAQESLYFLDQLTKGLPVYHIPQAFRLRGKLDLGALKQALEYVVSRHEALRTKIRETGDGPIQEVGHECDLSFGVHDLTGFDELRREGELHSGIAWRIAEPFVLSGETLFRADLFRSNAEEHVLLFTMHHVVGDMASFGVLYRHLEEGYGAFLKGTEPELAGEIVQLSDYANERSGENTGAESVNYWRERLKGFTPELEFPLDFGRPKLPSFRGDTCRFEIPAEQSRSLKALARANRCSMYMLCLAALEVLVYRYSNQQRFTIGAPFSERDDLKLENTIGYLINLLPIPCELNPNLTFRELLAAVRNTCLESYSHHNVSFRRIVNELGITGENPKPSLARIVFQYFGGDLSPLSLSGLEAEQIQVHTGTSKFDLCFTFAEQAKTIAVEMEYDTDLFERGTIERLGRHLTALLESICANSDAKVRELSLMDASERKLLEQWNETATEYPRSATVWQLFEEQAGQKAQNTALLFGQEQMSYGELRDRAGEIAGSLQARGVNRGDFVGVCLDRSFDLIASLLGILKCGAAFVPFDSNYPVARLQYMFSNANVRFLLTDSQHAQIAPEGVAPFLVDQLTSEDATVFAEPGGVAEDIAYLMYTSGSTGNPKGVAVPHRAIIRLVRNTNFATFGPDELFLAFAPISFDASTLEIWGPLLNGATLAIYPPQFDSIEQFAEVLKQDRVTTLWLTAGLFNTIVDRDVASLKGVGQLLIGGDVLSVSHVRKALTALPDTTIINGYGPTENTTFTCCYKIPRELSTQKSIPIGKPISNTQVFILDDWLQRVPIGVPGDLYTAGDGLSCGYWNQPELTTKTFIEYPLEDASAVRLYRTGDRARFLPDGNIEFLGRRDTQVKIRGFRIELGEIEDAFRKLSEIEDVAVIVHEDEGGKALVAYVVFKPGITLDFFEIHSRISSVLPAHACPGRIIPLEKLPLGPNGKVDRKALPLPAVDISVAGEMALPATPIETRVAEIWRELLKVASLSVHDNFFHLGGESLLAMRAISHINREFNCHLSLARIFEAPTVRGISRFVETVAETSGSKAAVQGADSRPEPDVNSLSDSEVDALLNQLMANQ